MMITTATAAAAAAADKTRTQEAEEEKEKSKPLIAIVACIRYAEPLAAVVVVGSEDAEEDAVGDEEDHEDDDEDENDDETSSSSSARMVESKTATATLTTSPTTMPTITPTTTTTTTTTTRSTTTTINITNTTATITNTTALEELLIPSLLASITAQEWEQYRIEVVLGYDQGDVHWENPVNRQRVMDTVKMSMPSQQQRFLAINFVSIIKQEPTNRPHRIPFNELCRATYEYGADYLVRVNDDTHFTSNGWITVATQQLTQYHPPNVGVVGPTCAQGNTDILTHDMVHRTHLEIFNGDYYPTLFDNWYVDDWISAVYGENRTTTLANWTVTHVVTKYGQRYEAAFDQAQLLPCAVVNGQERIQQYMMDHQDDRTKADSIGSSSSFFTTAVTTNPILGTYRLANVDGPMRHVHEKQRRQRQQRLQEEEERL